MRIPLLPRELHASDRPSTTAQWTSLGRSLELERPPAERIVSDRFAPYFLTEPYRRVLAALRSGGGLTRGAERWQLASVATSALCRHRFIDDQLLGSLPAIEQVVLLGAGYDSRAYRFRERIESRPVFEVDLPPISRRKAEIVGVHRDVFGTAPVRSVEIDFRTQSLAERLTDSGFRRGAPTFVAWEGVAMYLPREAVAATAGALAEVCGAGSVLAMDAWRHVAGAGWYDQVRRIGERAIGLVGEPISYAAGPEELRALLADAGFAVRQVATAETLERRYATAGRRCDEGLYLLAAERW
jgi:methyltransferase (TIGR00027 family)